MKPNYFPSRRVAALFAACFFTFHLAHAQQKWANYTYAAFFGNLAFEGDEVWVATQGGLVRTNRISGAKQVYLPTNSGMKGSSVWDVLVDTSGVKWIGSEEGGLLRYDGVNWQQYQYINTGDTLIYVTDLHQDTRGRLWFTSQVNGTCHGCNKLFYMENGQFHRVPNMTGVDTDPYFRYLAPDNDGNMWAATGTTIAKIQSDTSFMFYNLTDIPLQINGEIIGMGFDRVRSQIYVTIGERLIRFDGLQWEEVIVPPNILLGYGRSFQNDPAGNFWIHIENITFYKNLITRYDGTNWTQYELSDLGLAGNYFSAVHFDEQGHMWISTFEEGQKLVEKQDTGWKAHDIEIFPIGTNYYNRAAFDKSGHAWLMGDNGLMEFDGFTWTLHPPTEFGANPLAAMRFSSIAFDTISGTLWAGLTSDDYDPMLIKYDGVHTTVYPLAGYSHRVTKIIPVADGKIWVSTNAGAGLFDGNQWIWYNQTNTPFASNYINDIVIDPSGRPWASVYPNQVFRFNGTQWILVPTLLGSYSWLFCDRSGYIWTGTGGGLARYDGTNWSLIPTPSGSGPFPAGYQLVQDFDLSYWVYANNKIWHWDGADDWQPFDLSNAPLTSGYYPSKISIDPFGNKWFLAAWGLNVYNAAGISNQFINAKSTARGTIFFDANQDGTQAASGEPGLPNRQVLMLPDSLWSFSVSQGLYTFFPEPGAHQIQYVPVPGFLLTSDSAQYHLPSVSTDQSGFDFGIWTPNPPARLSLDLQAGVLRCGWPNQLWINLSNQGFADAAGNITLTYDPALTFESATPPPTSTNGNILSWTYDQLAFGDIRAIRVAFEPIEIELFGDTLYHQVVATQNGNSHVLYDTISTVVLCSYDPNDKLVRPTGPSSGVLSLFSDPLEYTVRFQNTGNDTAFTVVVRDTLDADLDLSTLEIVSSSHPVRVQITSDRVATFIFDSINLLWETKDILGSQGYISYQIKSREGLPTGTTVRNTAHIYFDFNPAIVTNTTSNTLVDQFPSSAVQNEPAGDIIWKLYPNPSTGTVQIELPERGVWLRILDSTGRLMEQGQMYGKKGILQNLEPGFYLVCPEGMGCKKLVVIK